MIIVAHLYRAMPCCDSHHQQSPHLTLSANFASSMPRSHEEGIERRSRRRPTLMLGEGQTGYSLCISRFCLASSCLHSDQRRLDVITNATDNPPGTPHDPACPCQRSLVCACLLLVFLQSRSIRRQGLVRHA